MNGHVRPGADRAKRLVSEVGSVSIRSGETQELLLDMADQANTAVVSVFTLIAVGKDGINQTQQRPDAPVCTLLEID